MITRCEGWTSGYIRDKKKRYSEVKSFLLLCWYRWCLTEDLGLALITLLPIEEYYYWMPWLCYVSSREGVRPTAASFQRHTPAACWRLPHTHLQVLYSTTTITTILLYQHTGILLNCETFLSCKIYDYEDDTSPLSSVLLQRIWKFRTTYTEVLLVWNKKHFSDSFYS